MNIPEAHPEQAPAIPTLVLLPGLDGTGMLFDSLVASLAGRIPLRVVDYPTDATLGYEALEAVARRALPANGSFIILGESFSGPIAVALAAAAGPALQGLILCCTFVRSPFPGIQLLGQLAGMVPASVVPDAIVDYFLLGESASPAISSALKHAISRVTRGALRARLLAAGNVDVSNRLRDVRAPVLYLRADRDRLVPRSASKLMARLRPDMRIVDFEAPHCLLQTVPAAAAEAITGFIDAISSNRNV